MITLQEVYVNVKLAVCNYQLNYATGCLGVYQRAYLDKNTSEYSTKVYVGVNVKLS